MPEVRNLIQNLNNMPHGSAQAEAARSLWNLAQKDNDPKVRFDALVSVMQAANFSGVTDFFVSLFPQMIALKKSHPEAIDMHTYVWRLKWFAASLKEFPEVSNERIEGGLRYYQEALHEIGGNNRTFIYLKWHEAYSAGHFAKAEQLRKEFTSMKRDSNADCLACEVNSMVTEAVHVGDHARALEIAEPILTRRLHCGSVPHSTYANLLIPCLLMGKNESAASYHRKGYALVRANVGEVDKIGDHLGYLAALGDEAKCLRLLRMHIPWLDHNFSPFEHLDFLTGAAAALRMITEHGTRKRPLRLPLHSKFSLKLGMQARPIAEFARVFEDEAQQLAEAFDRRNGTSWRSDYLARTWKQISDYRAQHGMLLDE